MRLYEEFNYSRTYLHNALVWRYSLISYFRIHGHSRTCQKERKTIFHKVEHCFTTMFSYSCVDNNRDSCSQHNDRWINQSQFDETKNRAADQSTTYAERVHAMKRTIRILLCIIISFITVYLSGYGNLMNDISESLAATTFIGAVVVLAILFSLLLEMYLCFKSKINELTKRIDELEQKR